MQIQSHIHLSFTHRLAFTTGVFDPGNRALADCFDVSSDGRRLIAFVDRGFLNTQPGIDHVLNAYCNAHADRMGELAAIEAVPGGETSKNDPRVLNHVIDRIDAAHIDRWSTVLCIGGGAVLDVVGFAASTVHRGVRLLRVPTTPLAQADSGIGVKCGVNHRGKKNLLGAFAVPQAVVCDPTLCRTLSDEDWRCGFAEAVKVALIKDAALFARMQADAAAIAQRDEATCAPIIERSAELHFRHITEGGDPFESGAARPLDMGHWSAHKLEQLTNFDLRHGDAVAIGLAIDLAYTADLGLIAPTDAEAAIALLQSIGFRLAHPVLTQTRALLEGLDEFREHLGGPLTLVMPTGIGSTTNVHEVNHAAMRRAIERIAAGASA